MNKQEVAKLQVLWDELSTYVDNLLEVQENLYHLERRLLDLLPASTLREYGFAEEEGEDDA